MEIDLTKKRYTQDEVIELAGQFQMLCLLRLNEPLPFKVGQNLDESLEKMKEVLVKHSPLDEAFYDRVMSGEQAFFEEEPLWSRIWERLTFWRHL